MIDLSTRSYVKELMDEENIPFAAIEQTLKELNTINTWLGGHAITIRGVRRLMEEQRSIHVCEIGCGGGDNLHAIEQHARKNGLSIRYTGIDLNPDCITYAQQKYPQLPCEWICSDYRHADFKGEKPGIIFSSLFCHHFTDEQMVAMLKWLDENSSIGFFINDLHRHWLAYYLIKYITRFFSRSYLVKNDASLSVARSFRKEDWEKLFATAGIRPFDMEWRWAFRFLVTRKK